MQSISSCKGLPWDTAWGESVRKTFGQLMVLYKKGLCSNPRSKTESCSQSEETAAHISQSSWELGKPLQAHHAFHYTLIPPACQAESRARLPCLTAPRQMAVMKGNFHPLQSKTTSEAPSVGARQAAGPGGPCPTSHAPALARSRQRWCRSSADVLGEWRQMPQLPSAPSDAQTALHEQGLLSATLLKEPGFPSLLTGN